MSSTDRVVTEADRDELYEALRRHWPGAQRTRELIDRWFGRSLGGGG